jgi:hypothetical protein
MRTCLCFALMWLAATAFPLQAAPIQGVVRLDQQGQTTIRNLAGEIYIALGGPLDLYLPSNSTIPDVPRVPELGDPERRRLTLLNLGGITGEFFFGNVVKTGLPAAQYQQLRLSYQSTFTTEIVELSPTFVPNLAAIPPGQVGFYLVGVPEPSTLGMAGLSLVACIVASRLARQSG